MTLIMNCLFTDELKEELKCKHKKPKRENDFQESRHARFIENTVCQLGFPWG